MTATVASSELRSFRPDVEGLRAVAVMLVLLDHAGVARLSGGYIGVDVFFVLSGFLITGLLLKEYELKRSISIVGFYARRARRILPAGMLVLASTVIASAVLIGGTSAGRTTEDAQWAGLFASNFRFIQQGTDYWASDLPQSPLQHYWSLSIEEQFYLVWPACLIAVALIATRISLRAKLSVFLVALIAGSLLWSMHETAVNGTVAYFSPFTRTWELAAGALLAVSTPWILRLPRLLGVAMSLTGIAAIAAASVLFDEYTHFPGSAAMLPIGGAVLAVAGGTVAPGRGAERLLGLAPFQWIGKLSYSLYLWHWPLLILTASYMGRDLSLAESLFLCLIALALSVVTFWLVESPARNSGWLKARPSAVSVAAGLAVVVIAVGLATGLKATLPSPSNVEGSIDDLYNSSQPADAP